MERFDLHIKYNKQDLALEVKEYLHHSHQRCKIEVYQDNKLLVSFNPDDHETLSLCQNPGALDNKLVHLIADKIEEKIDWLG
ncbi:hypothetical protein D0C36_21880 [Mucilaginibacter conchicola]|uniref:Uncharacterized protein n=1 Tax=Mucilaginibacter conchicola TaxID=2303333 RepID=A0A372NNC2_9SPHI|nr:hypothetical protein [Mucilaginibacter conchicola]RFZ90442.1 hypothetical protein D0C36_21880 [Mucilaginibacter conchicola]